MRVKLKLQRMVLLAVSDIEASLRVLLQVSKQIVFVGGTENSIILTPAVLYLFFGSHCWIGMCSVY